MSANYKSVEPYQDVIYARVSSDGRQVLQVFSSDNLHGEMSAPGTVPTDRVSTATSTFTEDGQIVGLIYSAGESATQRGVSVFVRGLGQKVVY